MYLAAKQAFTKVDFNSTSGYSSMTKFMDKILYQLGCLAILKHYNAWECMGYLLNLVSTGAGFCPSTEVVSMNPNHRIQIRSAHWQEAHQDKMSNTTPQVFIKS